MLIGMWIVEEGLKETSVQNNENKFALDLTKEAVKRKSTLKNIIYQPYA